MNDTESVLGRKVTKRYPRRGALQLVRLHASASFACAECTQTKTARLVALRGDGHICNACYGQMNAETPAPPLAPPASAVAPPASDIAPPADPVDLSRVVVEEPDGWAPHSVVNTGLTVEWKFHVRAEHLLHGTCPVPDEMADRAPDVPLDITFLRARYRIRVLDEQQGIRLRRDGDPPRLTGIAWQPFVLPGTRVSARWDLRTGLRFAYTPLDSPVVLAGTVIRYDYDPRVITRDLAAFDARVDRVEELVLITLRELGYLDEQGRALLPDAALVRNTLDRNPAERPRGTQVRAAIERLLERGVLTLEQGSIGVGGHLHHPARGRERPVPLLCYAPTPRVAATEDLRAADGQGTSALSAHRVAGHLMRIGHLGKEASAEAEAAYRHDHRKAGLAGPHELPRGYTYVREHDRGM
ncbi:hypothetical protein [Streptomyces sp. NPDC058955]|uniref:hypothetical protein n=1 Tax=unclassified Streptomyces TaxID=2593676 RepID=UPI0036578017